MTPARSTRPSASLPARCLRAMGLLVLGVLGCAPVAPAQRAAATTSQLLAVRTPSGRPAGLPPNCRREGRVVLFAVEPLRTLDVEAVAERYRQQLGVPVEVARPVPAATIAPAWNVERGQYDRDAALAAAWRFQAVQDPAVWAIGLTDVDLFDPARNWRFCFSGWNKTGGLISTARLGLDGADPVLVATRTFKLLTRMLAETYCRLERGGPPQSVLRPTLMSVEDLDGIDESVWVEGPVSL